MVTTQYARLKSARTVVTIFRYSSLVVYRHVPSLFVVASTIIDTLFPDETHDVGTKRAKHLCE